MPSILERTNNLKVKLVGAALFTVGMTATLVNVPWFITSRNNVESVVGQLNQEVMRGASEKVDTIFNDVSSTKKFILDSYKNDLVDYTNVDQQTHFFADLIESNPNFTWINFGYANGDYFGVQRLETEGMVKVHIRRWEPNVLGQNFDPERAQRYQDWTDHKVWDEAFPKALRTVDLVNTKVDPWSISREISESQIYYAPARPFYSVAIPNPGEDAWTDLYLFATGNVVGLDSSITFEENQKIVGVISISFALKQISDYLEKLDIAKYGGIFIVNSKNEMVAFSKPSELVGTLVGDQKPELKKIGESDDPLLTIASYTLQHNSIALGNMDALETFLVKDPNSRRKYYVSFKPLPYLDWTVGTVIPESYFMTEINKNKRNLAFIIAGLVLGTSVLAALLAERFLAKPILAVAGVAGDIKSGNFELSDLDSVSVRQDEFGQLARVFKAMAREVYEREQKLKQQVQELTIEIDEEKRQQEVKEVTESEFFQELQEKARLIRERRQKLRDERSGSDNL